MPFIAIAALAAITYTFRIAGPLLAGRVTVPDSAQRLFASAAAVLLVALAATSALTTGHDFAGWARPAGVLVAGVLAARRVPFPVVVLAAASVTALLRLAGIHLSRTAGADSRTARPPRKSDSSDLSPRMGTLSTGSTRAWILVAPLGAISIHYLRKQLLDPCGRWPQGREVKLIRALPGSPDASRLRPPPGPDNLRGSEFPWLL